MVKCHEIMTANPVCCLATDLVEGIAQWMRTEDIGAVLVVENYQTRKLTGIVTDRDLALRVIGARRQPDDTRIKEVMTPNPITCQPDDEVETAMDIMAQHKVRRLPVVDAREQLVGIISQADLATRLRDPHKATDVIEEISQPDSIAVHS